MSEESELNVPKRQKVHDGEGSPGEDVIEGASIAVRNATLIR